MQFPEERAPGDLMLERMPVWSKNCSGAASQKSLVPAEQTQPGCDP
jgi:hypothetical protein